MFQFLERVILFVKINSIVPTLSTHDVDWAFKFYIVKIFLKNIILLYTYYTLSL